MAACNGFTRECGPLSNVVTAQTEDGVAGRPKAVQVACRHDNISGMNYVEVRHCSVTQICSHVSNNFPNNLG